jgi:hypothetical protein
VIPQFRLFPKPTVYAVIMKTKKAVSLTLLAGILVANALSFTPSQFSSEGPNASGGKIPGLLSRYNRRQGCQDSGYAECPDGAGCCPIGDVCCSSCRRIKLYLRYCLTYVQLKGAAAPVTSVIQQRLIDVALMVPHHATVIVYLSVQSAALMVAIVIPSKSIRGW